MGARTAQEDLEEVLTKILKIFITSIVRLVQDGKRSGEKVLRLLQMVKDDPRTFELLDGVLHGTHEIKPIDHFIDLSYHCMLPFSGAERMSPPKSGIVKLERRGDELFLDGKTINLFLSWQQKANVVIVGHEFPKEVEKRGSNISAKVLDYLVAHPGLWPESWKNKDGGIIDIFFLDDIFRDPGSNYLCARHGCWIEDKIVPGYRWLHTEWLMDSRVAILEP